MKTQNYNIMKNSIFKMAICLCTVLFFTNCSKSDDGDDGGNISCFGGTWIEEVSQELSDWAARALAYNQNPTLENCNSLRNAMVNYFDALDRIKDCVPTISLVEFNEAKSEIETEISEINCDN